MPQDLPAKRRTWTPPAPPPPGKAAAAAASAWQSGLKTAGKYANQLLGTVVLFGFISILFWSWFPLALGLFFFVNDDQFIEWVLASVGIRLVPDTLGSHAVRAFVFLAALGAVCTTWKNSVPVPLAPWVPVDGSWLETAGAALVIAVLAVASRWVTRHILPRIGIERPTDTMRLAVEGVFVLALLAAVFAMSAIFS
jgi:hypothetical protein